MKAGQHLTIKAMGTTENIFYRVSEYNENWNKDGIEYDLGTDSPWMTHGVIRNSEGEKVGLANNRDTTDAFPDKFTLIESNGSKWLGQHPDDLDKLYSMLCDHKLILHFYPGYEAIDNYEWYRQLGMIRFHGNFQDISHCFSVDTNDSGVIKMMLGHLTVNRNL